MIQLPLAWTLVAASLWAAASSQPSSRLLPGPVNILYPKILSNETIECNCVENCYSAHWYYVDPSKGLVTFLGKYNNADRVNYGDGVNKSRFKFSKRGSSAFVLRVINVTEDDAGIYSCVLVSRSNTEMWRPGTRLLPGVTQPTLPPPTKPKPPVKKTCSCKKKPLQAGCGSLVLWPLVGLIAGLALAVICTLYYFSRLPKKCRHQFVKRSR